LRSIFAFVDLSVIIVSYNVKYFLEHCLLSVTKACVGIEAEIFAIDNNSKDNSRELEAAFPSVKFYWNEENLGFAKANNSVLSQATGNHILFLNPDTIIPEDCFNKCIYFFRSTKDCGALGVRMIDGSGKFLRESKRSLPGIFSAFYKTIGLSKLLPQSKIFSAYYAGHLPEKENNKIEVLAGAFMMLSRKAMELTGGFDEDFFMYGEDVDLSYRIMKGGLSNYYFADTTIIHFKGESTGRQTKKYRNYFYGAMRLFAKKHHAKQTLRYFFIKAGIAVSETLSSFAARKDTPRLNTGKPMVTAVLGNEREFESVKEILKSREEFLLQPIVTAEEAISKTQSIIFCEGSRSNKHNIQDLEKLPSNITAMFYTKQAHSIIGSHDKNSNGFFITKQ
jgi:GT2 family glycosyltransferase